MSVTPPRAADNASICLARLKAQAPETFRELIGNFSRMRDEATIACVMASLDKVQVMQGKAQQLADLVTLLEGCTETAHGLEARMKEKK